MAKTQRRSSSLQKALTKQRDTTRMKAFMNKKNAQNLPFFNRDNSQVRQLQFNSLLRINSQSKTHSRNSVKNLQQQLDCQTASISFLKIENSDLKTSTTLNSKKVFRLGKTNRITETYKTKLKTKKKKTEDMERKMKETQTGAKSLKREVISLEYIIQDLKMEKALLQHEVTGLKAAEAQHSSRMQHYSADLKEVLDSAQREIMYLSSIVSILHYCGSHFGDGYMVNDCRKCGSKERHPKTCCPADGCAVDYSVNCGCCEKKGHFTL